MFDYFSGAFLSVAGLIAPVDSAGAEQAARGTVSGNVNATEDGEPIPGVSVSLAGQTTGALTRGDGSYRFVAPAGSHQLVIRLIGYANGGQSVTVVAGQTVPVNVALKRAAATLAAVAVVGSPRGERSVTSAPVPVDVITVEQITQTVAPRRRRFCRCSCRR